MKMNTTLSGARRLMLAAGAVALVMAGGCEEKKPMPASTAPPRAMPPTMPTTPPVGTREMPGGGMKPAVPSSSSMAPGTSMDGTVAVPRNTSEPVASNEMTPGGVPRPVDPPVQPPMNPPSNPNAKPTDPTPPASGGNGTTNPNNTRPANPSSGDAPSQNSGGVTIGTARIGNFDVTVSQGAVPAAGSTKFMITLAQGANASAATKPRGVVAWFGSQDGKVGRKASATVETGMNYAVTVDVPTPPGADSRLWVEVEDEKGNKSTSGFDVKKA
ncbi:hypothetical protein BH11PLA1_BH11PLA1_03820 [soil metagenome]